MNSIPSSGNLHCWTRQPPTMPAWRCNHSTNPAIVDTSIKYETHPDKLGNLAAVFRNRSSDPDWETRSTSVASMWKPQDGWCYPKIFQTRGNVHAAADMVIIAEVRTTRIRFVDQLKTYLGISSSLKTRSISLLVERKAKTSANLRALTQPSAMDANNKGHAKYVG